MSLKRVETRSNSTVSNNQLRSLHVSGAQIEAWLSQLCTRASISTGMGTISELAFTFQDDADATLFRSGLFKDKQTVSYGHWRGRLKGGARISNGRGGPEVQITAPSLFVERLRDQTGAKNWGTQDVGEWVAARAKEVGMKTEVQPGLGRKSIVREKGEGDKLPNTWDVITEMAQEVGAWVFETGRTLIMGKPEWLLRNRRGRRQIAISWRSSTEMSGGLIEMPSFTPGAQKDQELTVKIMGDQVDHILPGDVLALSGRLNAGTRATNANGWWLVRDVSLPLNRTAPVTLTCMRANRNAL